MRRGDVDRIIVVAPTEHLKTQWADAAARVRIRLDPAFTQPPLRRPRGTITESW